MAAWEVAKAAEPRGEVELTPPHGSLSRPHYPWPASPPEEPHNVSCSHCSGSLEAYLRTVYTVGHHLAKVRQMAPGDLYISQAAAS